MRQSVDMGIDVLIISVVDVDPCAAGELVSSFCKEKKLTREVLLFLGTGMIHQIGRENGNDTIHLCQHGRPTRIDDLLIYCRCISISLMRR